MTLHLEGVHICHILKQWLRRLYRYSLSAKKEICMVEADTHIVWDQFNTEVPKGPAFCSRGRTTIESC